MSDCIFLDGNKAAAQLKSEISSEVERLRSHACRVPCLCIFLVEGDEGSEVYVRNKNRVAAETGIETRLVRLPHDTTEKILIEAVARANEDDSIDAMIVQLPLPEHISETKVLSVIRKDKDADAHIKEDAVSSLLRLSGADTEGRAVIITENNRPRSLTAEQVPFGAIVIDMGFTCIDDPSAAKGYRIVGDVDMDTVRRKAAYIAPVPGGVGPMIIAMLMQHTLAAYKKSDL